METIFKSEYKVHKKFINNINKDVIERKFILDSLKELPIDKLKRLVNFEEIDFENKKIWDDPVNLNLLDKLRSEKVVLYLLEITE